MKIKPIETVGIVLREGIPEAVSSSLEVARWALSVGAKIVVSGKESKILLGAGCPHQVLSAPGIAAQAHPIITLGGDGTLIGIARYVECEDTVLIGVNYGTLGFLTELAPTELPFVLQRFAEGEAHIGSRSMLLVRVLRGQEEVFSSQAVNDVVVQRGTCDSLIDLDFAVNGEHVMRLRADGLILATPTGSTAYSLAAGGAIMYPHLEAVLVTPICPHSLTNRPLILPLDATFEVTLPKIPGEVRVIVDGQVSVPLLYGDTVEVSRARHAVHFVRSPSRSYFDILRQKLNWGVGNKNEESC